MAGYDKSDYWARKAQGEGYPARSVYKLQEINDKFHILPHEGAVLDLGAAPGSWTVYVLRNTECRVVSCDLNPLSKSVKSDRLTFIQGDLNSKEVREKILGAEVASASRPRNDGFSLPSTSVIASGLLKADCAKQPLYDAVICDAAPLTTGNKTVDTARSEQLVEMAIWYSEHALKEGGGFAVKIFQNGSQRQFLDHMRQIFTEARGFKPQACRSQSVETYLVGTKKCLPDSKLTLKV